MCLKFPKDSQYVNLRCVGIALAFKSNTECVGITQPLNFHVNEQILHTKHVFKDFFQKESGTQ